MRAGVVGRFCALIGVGPDRRQRPYVYNSAMEPMSPPSTGALKMFWGMRHIFKAWGIGREERREYGRLLP
jgi:hypothetical protein